MPIDLGIPYFCFKFCHMHPPLEAITCIMKPFDVTLYQLSRVIESTQDKRHNEAFFCNILDYLLLNAC